MNNNADAYTVGVSSLTVWAFRLYRNGARNVLIADILAELCAFLLHEVMLLGTLKGVIYPTASMKWNRYVCVLSLIHI